MLHLKAVLHLWEKVTTFEGFVTLEGNKLLHLRGFALEANCCISGLNILSSIQHKKPIVCRYIS